VSHHSKPTTRSRRMPPKQLDERLVVCRSTGDQPGIQLMLPMAPTMIIEGELEKLMLDAGRLMIMGFLNEEVEAKAGKRYAHEGDAIKRWGREDGHAIIAGQKVAIQRPRLRGPNGEVPLTRYEAFRQEGRMQRAVAGKVMRRVSMRDYEGAIETFGAGYGIRKSSVSRHWVAASTAELAKLQTRRLEGLEIVAVMIDGIAYHGEMVLVALGVSSDGTKHILGLRDGATENSEVVKALLDDLVERGLDRGEDGQRFLFVVDGAKALTKAIRVRFGDRAEIQRCQAHKERNLLGHLPDGMQDEAQRRLRAAWGLSDYHKAKAELERVGNWLEQHSHGAAASLAEGLEETLTIHRLGMPPPMRRSFRTTNPIESPFAHNRDHSHNVRKWKDMKMRLRWAGTLLLDAEKRFRRVQHAEHMPALLHALGRLDAASKTA